MDARVDERLDTLIALVGELRGEVAGLKARMTSLEDRFRHNGSGNMINWNIILVAFIVALGAATFTWFVSVAR